MSHDEQPPSLGSLLVPRGDGALDAAGGAPKKKLRQRFGPDEDHLLAVQVRADLPFTATHGRIGSEWDRVAAKLNGDSDFNMHPIKGTTAKARFDALVTKHRKRQDDAEGYLLAGTTHEYYESDEFIVLMTELCQRVDNFLKGAQGPAQAQDAAGTEGEEVLRRRHGGKRQRSDSDSTEQEESDEEDAAVLRRCQKRKPRANSIVPTTTTSGADVDVAKLVRELDKQGSKWKRDMIALQERLAEHTHEANRLRLRQEEQRTKQLELELQIEQQRQLELRSDREERELERREREKDREERESDRQERAKDRCTQAELITSLVKVLTQQQQQN